MTGLGETPFFSFIIFSFLFFNYEGETIYYVPEGRDGRGNGRDTVESCEEEQQAESRQAEEARAEAKKKRDGREEINYCFFFLALFFGENGYDEEEDEDGEEETSRPGMDGRKQRKKSRGEIGHHVRWLCVALPFL
ncbi:uncharacterized protein ARB_04418 [Trichophyton benhamiae CBS 112371]|uniref:Uncharacterized protein n=1 Tax=Arthroderma benhamiae (strain ATCC MYA-4681 / CBS 112371) TaxID=663331 RepID=D4AJG8_ARTBC|nr:uncharacterized protein ARB_04418 [Trichophyton benhamiae CBS 112371]EFE36891.1 hypothetical protein ARB_04418 [Trichophyton benhamiae CBS 112371]